ncbi:MAG: hypothetical protein LUG18_14930 [Candidatus Azobacteroides sp.]|nr:hypothetical protein [Candidatus Azobacteroides sp.]
MDIKELRKGNLLQTKEKEINTTRIGNNIVIVTDVWENDIQARDAIKTDQYGILFDLDDCEGIELSEYILEFCGFRKEEEFIRNKSAAIASLSQMDVVYIYDKEHNGYHVEVVIIRENGEYKMVIDDPTTMYGYKFSEAILSLHALQNIFFDVTQTSMAIEL